MTSRYRRLKKATSIGTPPRPSGSVEDTAGGWELPTANAGIPIGCWEPPTPIADPTELFETAPYDCEDKSSHRGAEPCGPSEFSPPGLRKDRYRATIASETL